MEGFIQAAIVILETLTFRCSAIVFALMARLALRVLQTLLPDVIFSPTTANKFRAGILKFKNWGLGVWRCLFKWWIRYLHPYPGYTVISVYIVSIGLLSAIRLW